MDRRLAPHSGRIALASLRGVMVADAYTQGTPARVAVPVADLRASPGGARDRQVLHGEALTVIDRQDSHAFVQAHKDGYCGWIADAALGPDHPVSHRVTHRLTHLYPDPKVKAEAHGLLSLGALVEVTTTDGRFARTPGGWVPMDHLTPLDRPLADPVAVAAGLLGTPYLWGGNSALGIDCSGLIQAALTVCGCPCPGDSDLQAKAGAEVPEDALIPGDLVFWKGHVAMVSGQDEIVHATAAFMSTVRESLSGATARIVAQGGGPITHRRRLR